jgi:hypothetical protein
MIVIYKLFVISGLNKLVVDDLLPLIKNMWLQLEMIVIKPPSLEAFGKNSKIVKDDITYRKTICYHGRSYTVLTFDEYPIIYYFDNIVICISFDKFNITLEKLYYNKKAFANESLCSTQLVSFYYFHCNV